MSTSCLLIFKLNAYQWESKIIDVGEKKKKKRKKYCFVIDSYEKLTNEKETTPREWIKPQNQNQTTHRIFDYLKMSNNYFFISFTCRYFLLVEGFFPFVSALLLHTYLLHGVWIIIWFYDFRKGLFEMAKMTVLMLPLGKRP